MNLEKYKIEFLIETLQSKNISDNEYFSDEYKQYVSNSKLKLINPCEGGSPQKFAEGIQSSYNPSFEFGSAVHQLVLQPDEFELIDYNDKPSAKLGLFIDKIIEFRKQGFSINDSINKASYKADYYKGKLTKKIIKTAIQKGLKYYYDVVFNNLYDNQIGKTSIILSEKLKNSVIDCINSVYKNNTIKYLLHHQNLIEEISYINEQALFIDIAVTLPNNEVVIIPFKLKFDNYSIDPEKGIITLNDLKTTGKPVSYFMGNFVDILDDKGIKTGEQWINGSFQNYCYYRQMGIYMMILQLYCKYVLELEGYIYKSNMMVIESTPEYRSSVFPVSQAYIKEGLKEFKELICRVAWHEKYGYDKELEDE